MPHSICNFFVCSLPPPVHLSSFETLAELLCQRNLYSFARDAAMVMHGHYGAIEACLLSSTLSCTLHSFRAVCCTRFWLIITQCCRLLHCNMQTYAGRASFRGIPAACPGPSGSHGSPSRFEGDTCSCPDAFIYANDHGMLAIHADS
jgi:hypothetical protein